MNAHNPDNGLALARTLALSDITTARDFFLRRNADCPLCKDDGWTAYDPETNWYTKCPACDGKGGPGPDYEPELVKALDNAIKRTEAGSYTFAHGYLCAVEGWFAREDGGPVSEELEPILGAVRAARSQVKRLGGLGR